MSIPVSKSVNALFSVSYSLFHFYLSICVCVCSYHSRSLEGEFALVLKMNERTNRQSLMILSEECLYPVAAARVRLVFMVSRLSFTSSSLHWPAPTATSEPGQYETKLNYVNYEARGSRCCEIKEKLTPCKVKGKHHASGCLDPRRYCHFLPKE